MSSSKIRRVIGTIDLTIDLTAEETIDLTLMEEQQEDRMLSVGVEREDEEGCLGGWAGCPKLSAA